MFTWIDEELQKIAMPHVFAVTAVALLVLGGITVILVGLAAL